MSAATCPYCGASTVQDAIFCGSCNRAMFPSHGDCIVVGRDDNPHADARVPGSGVSSFHCEITCLEGKLYLSDGNSAVQPIRSSTNGTFLHMKRGKTLRLRVSESRPLERGDMIQLGTNDAAIYAVERLLSLARSKQVDDYSPDIVRDALDVSEFHRDRVLSGHGATAVVYQGSRAFAGDEVAIKVLRREYRSVDSTVYKRFIQEIHLMKRLSLHPRIVTLVAAGSPSLGSEPLLYSEDEFPWMALEYMGGGTLADAVQSRRPLSDEERIQWMIDVLDAVDFLHHQSIIHRDLKPDNILLDAEREHCYLADLGIAHVGENASTDLKIKTEKTSIGFHPGTVGYMPPEQLSPVVFIGVPGAYDWDSVERAHSTNGIDARADVYACGLILHYIFTGRDPIPYLVDETDAVDVARALEFMKKFDAGGAPELVQHIVRKATRYRPCDRYESCAQMRRDLIKVLTAIRPVHVDPATPQPPQLEPAPPVGGSTRSSSNLPIVLGVLALIMVLSGLLIGLIIMTVPEPSDDDRGFEPEEVDVPMMAKPWSIPKIEPGGVRVSVEGKQLGAAPLKIKGEPGTTYDLEFSKPGCARKLIEGKSYGEAFLAHELELDCRTQQSPDGEIRGSEVPQKFEQVDSKRIDQLDKRDLDRSSNVPTKSWGAAPARPQKFRSTQD